MPFSLTPKTRAAAIGFFAIWVSRLWFATVRVSIVKRNVYGQHFRKVGRPHHVVAASWHRHFIFLFYFFHNRRRIIIFGNPVHIPADLSGQALETLCRELEDGLNRLTDRVDRISGHGHTGLRSQER